MVTLSLPAIASVASRVLSWRNLAILLLLLNFKSLPVVWHLRLFLRVGLNWYYKYHVRQIIKNHVGPRHPLFEPVSIRSITPLMELDYNIHKSNSTFFSDLDISRTALVWRKLSPGYKEGFRELTREGFKGNLVPILGSVHTSFKAEIKAYETYEIRSRILGWDDKWLVIGSWFISPAKQGGKEKVFASALSKYVFKKGRYTVPPERALRTSGWLPERPTESESVAMEAPPDKKTDDAASSGAEYMTRPVSQGVVTTPGGSRLIGARIPGKPSIEYLEDTILKDNSGGPAIWSPRARSRSTEHSDEVMREENKEAKAPASLTKTRSNSSSQRWSWEEIDQERRRGLEVARGWLNLDEQLLTEYSRPL